MELVSFCGLDVLLRGARVHAGCSSVVIQILFFLSVMLGLALALGLPTQLFIQFSDFVKRKLQTPKGSIPVGAFMLWASGETLEFGLKTLERFG